MTVSALKRPSKGIARPTVAERAAANIHETCDRLERLYRGLSAPGMLDEEMKRERLPDPLPTLAIFRRSASTLLISAGAESLMYYGLTAGNDAEKPGLLLLRHWEFLAQYATQIASTAEQAFALDLPDAAAHLFVHGMELLSRLALEIDGFEPPPKPKDTPTEGDVQH